MISGLILHEQYVWLVVASFLAGVMNAMAGGGSFVSFPAMLAIGVAPIQANATNTVALWPGQLTSIAALRTDLRRDLLPTVLAASVVGGVAGAVVLLRTAQVTFLHLIPWLLLLASLLFWASDPISKWLKGRSVRAGVDHRGERPIERVALFFVLLPVSFYIGYFGAGSGFLIMTVLALFGMESMHELNALKVTAAGTANLCAVLTFVLRGAVEWQYCLVSMVFAGVGGYVGAQYARRMNPAVLRTIAVVVGMTVAGYFFWRQA